MPRTLLALALLFPAVAAAAEPAAPSAIKFKKTQLDAKFRSEGVAVGDYNHDGKLDIAAGSVYYAAPDWKMVNVQEKAQEYDPLRYSNSFCCWADDLNADGWTDLIVVDFPGTPTWWFENPREPGGVWKQHLCTPVTNNESPNYLDVDGDGIREFVMGVAPDSKNSDGPDRQMAIVRRPSAAGRPWHVDTISAKEAPGTKRYSHGLGIGDVNRDGRNDVVVPQGWWESPDSKGVGEWTFHAAPLGQDCAHMHVFDFDGDGDNDVLSSAAHRVGIWHHERTADGWKTHEIENSFTQTHAMCAADINRDGLPDFVTGKRYWAHGPKGDINPGDPAVLYWFELGRKDGKAVWTPHQIDNDSGVGTQFEVADVNADGKLDIAISNKKGVYYFEQQ